MAIQRGRCTNTEFCAVAVSNKIVAVADGDPFVCNKCGDPLESVAATRAKGRRLALIAFQVAALGAGGAAVAWKLSSKPAGPAQAASATAEPASAVSPGTLVTGASFVAVQARPEEPATARAAAPAAIPQQSADLRTLAPAAAAVQAARPSPAKVLLRLAGSDTLSNNLMQRLAAGYLSLIGDTGIAAALDPSDNTVEVAGLQAGRREAVKVAPTSSAAGFNALLRGTADMTLSIRKVTSGEVESLASVGDLTSPANERVIGAQGIAAIVSPANRVPALTTAQLRSILAGQFKDWSELGGAPGPIHVFTLDNQDGGADAAEDILMGADGVTSSARRAASETALAAAVAGDRGGIGFVTVGNSGTARVVPVSDGALIPLMPTDFDIATESYPLTRRLYFYTGGDTSGGYARRFSDYVASPAGQAVVEAAGLVPVSVKAVQAVLPDAAPDRLRQLVTGASRISVDFRFQQNSTELNSHGTRDLERLVAYVKAQRIAPSRIILAAFSDNSGPAPVNIAVSQRRADAVAAALSKSGIPPGKVAAFGADLPVADNATGDGRERNRRVEVYLAP